MSRKKVKGRKSKGIEHDMEALLKYDGPKIEGLSFKVLTPPELNIDF